MAHKKRKLFALFLIIFGSVITIIGILILVLTIQMLLENNYQSERISGLILISLVLIFIYFLGIIPIIKGIKKLKSHPENNVSRKKSASKSKPLEDNKMDEGIKKLRSHLKNNISRKKSASESKSLEENKMGDRTAHRILCRDKQFDSDFSMIGFLIKCIFISVVPIILAIFFASMISASYHIQAGSWQAYVSLIVIIAGSALAMFGLYFCSKHHAIGNKFIYYIIDEEDGLYYAHMGLDALGNYVKKQATFYEKIKSAPSPLYIILYALSRQCRGNAYKLAMMQMYFKVNKKYRYAENLLLYQDYKQYCKKIVAVKNVRYNSKGCEATLVFMQNGVTHDIKQTIYHKTENYDLLMQKIKELDTTERNGYELTYDQMMQIRRNIYRRTRSFLLGILCFVLIAFFSYTTYLSASHKADVLRSGIFQNIEQMLANRSERRIYKVLFYGVFALLIPLVKMLFDLIKLNTFTYVPVEVITYYQPNGSVFQKLYREYTYFAKVKYGDITVDVGMSKEMWNRKKSAKPLLVLRKNIPYCLIYQE